MTPWAWEFAISFSVLALVSWYVEVRCSGDVDRAARDIKSFVARIKRRYTKP